MRQVAILKTAADLETLEITDQLVTAFVVGSSGIEDVSCEEEPVPTRLRLRDPENGEAVTLESDPLRWAELLPTAYRSGDYHVAVDIVSEERAQAGDEVALDAALLEPV